MPNVQCKKEDIYAYCFEAPAGAPASIVLDEQGNSKVNQYSNIHCILNINDPVIYLAPKDYSFYRFGNQYYVSDPLTDMDHASIRSRMVGFYNKVENASDLGSYSINKYVQKALFKSKNVLGNDITKHRWTQSRQLEDFFHRFAEAIKNRDQYIEEFEHPVRSIFATVWLCFTCLLILRHLLG